MQSRLFNAALGFCALNTCLVTSLGARPIDFDCDVPSDKFSSVMMTVPGPTYVASGTITAIEKRSGHYLPLVGLLIRRSDRPSTYSGFQLSAPSAVGENYRLTFRRQGTENDAIEAVGDIPLKGPVPFRFSLSSGGMLTLTLAGKSYTWSAGPNFAELDQAKMQAMCSTGQFKFFRLELSDDEGENSAPK